MYITTSSMLRVGVGTLLVSLLSCGDHLESAVARSVDRSKAQRAAAHHVMATRSAIIAIARAQMGRGPEGVGTRQRGYPHDLGRYLAPREAWCSEFVSWSYKVAGYSFAGGSQGGWMLRDSAGIKRWFKRQGRYTARHDYAWKDFQPQAGDYLRYNNDQGGHSGMITGTNGRDLFTVEGNVNNKVVELVITNWRERADLDGIGRLY